mmetsp:Transcript_10469/g.14793  ORF Transcript_10469/g.14793 Transcript_10469/m.14793 type:complete len:99 (-) Transcript_10469:49-345(-)
MWSGKFPPKPLVATASLFAAIRELINESGAPRSQAMCRAKLSLCTPFAISFPASVERHSSASAHFLYAIHFKLYIDEMMTIFQLYDIAILQIFIYYEK